jgi:MerR family transcriptional regulator, light-induced transcriptional regulator
VNGVVIACVTGELHDFPARLVADALDLAGCDTRFLGADVPVTSLLDTIGKEQPDLVALSVTMTFNIPAARTAVADLRRATESKFPIVIGGNACAGRPALAAELGADTTARNARDVVTAVDQLLGARP